MNTRDFGYTAPLKWPAFVCAVIEQARDGYWVALLGAVVFAGVLHVVLSP